MMNRVVYYKRPYARRKILKYTWFYILLPVVLVMNFFIVPVNAMPAGAMIRVGILSNIQTVLLSGDTDFDITNGETGKSLGHFSSGAMVTLGVQEKNITINNKKILGTKIHIVKAKNDNDHFLEVNHKEYRGNMDIHISYGKTGLTVVNVLPTEQYLYGVIGKEISPEWQLEAVKAQTVAARTYAVYNLGKHKIDDYDVCATIDCQVYGGRDNETPRVIKAVTDTAGEVLMYQGKVIPAYFHSSSGGYTENSENVWGTYQPYARGVVDYDQQSPNYKWEKKVTPSELEAALSKAGYHIGKIEAIELVPLTNVPMNVPERGVSGRVKVIRFIGTAGSAQLTGEKTRTILGLKSTLFDISVIVPMEKNIEFEIHDSAGMVGNKKVEINLPPTKEQGLVTDKQEIHRLSGRPNETVLISGFGWGHGLGLSQWGAKGMAEQGPQGDVTYYREILKHYYQGITIKKVF